MARSLVAGVNALFRREERRLPVEQRLVDDPYAGLLVERDPVVMAIGLLRFVIAPLRRAIDELRTAHGVRHASVDGLIRRGLEAGYAQVVIIGAGYDMRAARLGEAFPAVRWFEVDRPALLARKARLLGDRVPQGRVARIGVDLAKEPPLARLEAAGLDPRAPVLLVAEGLLHYLPRAATRSLLDALMYGGPRRVVLTTIHPDMVPRASGAFRWLVRLVREIPETFYREEDLSALATRYGLSARVWSWDQQVVDFAPAARGRPVGVSQHVVSLQRPEEREPAAQKGPVIGA